MKRNILVFAFAAFFSFFMVNAQAQSSFHSLIDDDAMEYIGELAHPAQIVLKAECIESTSSYIDISIQFESLMRGAYWEPYRINLRQYEDITYAYSIVRTEAVSIYEPFIALDFHIRVLKSLLDSIAFRKLIDDDEAIRILYGTSVKELTKEQKAAVMLMDYCFGEE